MEDLVARRAALGELSSRRTSAASPGGPWSAATGSIPAQETKIAEGKGTDRSGHADGRPARVPWRSTRSPAPSISRLAPAAPHPAALIPGKPYGPEPMRGALGRLADHVIEHGIEGRRAASARLGT